MICYLDNAATTKVLDSAAKAAINMMQTDFGNPSAVHSGGISASKLLAAARENVAQVIGIQPKSLTFTGSGTEATNTALFGGAIKKKRFGKHIISTMIEHDATLNTLRELKQQGYEVELIRPQHDGTILQSDVENAMREDTILLSMMAVNNETGAILPYAACAQTLRKKSPNAFMHIDGVQAFGKIGLQLENCDFLSISAHKIGGLKGVGALYIKPGISIKPYIYGGGQESGMRSGTENLPGIAAFGAASQLRFENMEANFAHMQMLKDRLLSKLSASSMTFRLNSPANSVPYIVNISPMHSRSEIYIRLLSEKGIYIAGGSACAHGKKSHVLAAMELQKPAIDSALRISFCPETSIEDMDSIAAALPEIAERLG